MIETEELEIRILATDRGGPRELMSALLKEDLRVRASGDRVEERSGEQTPISLQSLIVAVGVGTLPKLLGVLRNWLAKSATRQVEVKLQGGLSQFRVGAKPRW